MSWVNRYVYARPETPQIYQEREPMEGETCARCGSDAVRRYPIAMHLGPRMAVKCQSCMYTVRIERPGPEDAWPPFRAVTQDWDASPAESVTRRLLEAGVPATEERDK
jgi:hypothetical protein